MQQRPGMLHDLRSLLGRNRWALGVSLAHPVGAMGFARGRDTSFALIAAWKRAAELAGADGERELDRSAEIGIARSLQTDLRARGSWWVNWDTSWMSSFKGPFLYFLIRRCTPQMIVETGVASGISTSFVLRALAENQRGRLISVDLPNLHPRDTLPKDREAGWVVPAGLRSRWTLSVGNALLLLPDLLGVLKEVDIFFHDSADTYDPMLWEFRTAWPALRPGGFLLSDDATANAAFPDFCREARVAARYGMDLGIARKQPSRI